MIYMTILIRLAAVIGLALTAVLPLLRAREQASVDDLPALRTWGCHQEKDARREFRIESPAADGGPGILHVKIIESQGPNHVQLTSPFQADSFEDLAVYRLCFSAKGVPERQMSVHLLGDVRPWTNSGLRETVSLSGEWEDYVLPFRYRRPAQESVKVDFFLGDAVGDVRIRDVSIEPLRGDETPPVDGPELTSAETRLRFDSEGAIRSMKRIGGHADVAAGLPAPPAFTLTQRVHDGTTATVGSDQARSIRVETQDGGRRFTYEFADMTVRVAARQHPKGGIACELSVDNRGRAAITGIEFPVVHAPACIGNTSADDRILYPRCDGGVVEDPLRTMGSRRLDDTYPGPLSCQLMAYYDGQDGLLIAALDASGHPKRFQARMDIDLRLSVEHLLPAVHGADVNLPYPVLLMAFQGDWHVAAQRYRQWAHEQTFCATPLAQRTDTPSWLKKGAIVTTFNPRAKTPDGGFRFTDEGLDAFLADLQEKTGLQVIPNNRGWERYGTWCGQEYLLPFPDAQTFRRQADISRRHGVGMIMLSGFRWTIEKPQPDGSLYSNLTRFKEQVEPFVTHSQDNEPLIWTSDKKDDWHGTRYARLCPSTGFAKQTVVDIARYCVEAGYPLIHFDQEVGGCAATSFCGSPDHGHPPGYGRWIHTGLETLYRDIRTACEPLDNDFALSMEEPNELYIPWLNLIQSRPNGLTATFPIKPPMTRVVPLFSFLYHDYVAGWIAFYPWRSQGHHCVTLAKGFAAGMLPGVHVESTYGWQSGTRDRFFTMLRNCCALYTGQAREFLLNGRMEPPLKTSIPTRQLKVGKQRTLSVPVVYHSVWSLVDGRRAALFFNPTTQPVTIQVFRTQQQTDTITVPALAAHMQTL